ncbi:MAG TPA: hypothetical protein VNZ45_01700 [Bacteroidia bacterium]|nr:hypothetical protein [Bacteroidia bacterium]
MVKRGTIYPVITIIGKDLEAAATFNASFDNAAQNRSLFPAGRFMQYSPTTKNMTPITTFTAGWAANVAGVLAHDVDNTDGDAVGMFYRNGTFLRQEVEAANQISGGIVAGSADDITLQGKGIFLEYSYERYEDIETPPPNPPAIP